MNWNRILHVAGAVIGSALIAVPMLTEVVPSQRLKVASVVLGAALAFVTNLKKAAGISAMLLLLLPLQGCAWLQHPAAQKAIKCTGDVIKACSADVLPTVTACLNAPANPTACLMALLNAGGCATTEALACRVKQAAEPSVIMTFVSPTDDERAASDRRRENAQRFYTDVGVRPE